MNSRVVLIVSAVLLLLVLVIAAQFSQREMYDPMTQLVGRNPEILVRSHSPTLGDTDAKVHIVAFLDPACETCRSFDPLVKKLMAGAPGRIRLTLRYAPFHSGSDYVVKLLEGARKQGKYWETLETLLTSQPRWVVNDTAHAELAWPQIQHLGLNLDQLRLDMEAPDIERLIVQDMADARALNVTKTPALFVNGRPVPSFDYEQLERLVQESLADAYR